jgi:hypothetical protein
MKTFIRSLAASLAVAATFCAAFVAPGVQAKSAHCTAVPVPGQPGHYVVVCSRLRP